MDQDLRQYLDNMESRIVSTLKAHVSEECENVETKLLAEFRKWGRGNDQSGNRSLTVTAL